MSMPGYTKPPPGRTVKWGHTLANGLILCLPMNELDGTLVNDLCLARNNGRMVGATWLGSDIDFDGTADYIQVGDTDAEPFDLSGSFSVSTWVNVDSNSGLNSALWNKAGNTTGDIEGWVVSLSATVFRYQFHGGGAAKSFTWNYTRGIWQNHIIVRDDSPPTTKTVKIYRNGVIVKDSTYLGTPDSNNFRFLIGSAENTAHAFTYPLTGQVRNTLVYNRALSDNDALSLYRQPYAMIR